MCGSHWRMVSQRNQAAVWKHYRHGQEIDKRPSREYLEAARAAIAEVAAKERAQRAAHQFDLFQPQESESR